MPFLTVSGKYYVLSGQHRAEAARKVAEEAQREARPIPSWAKHFKCRIAKADTTRAQREAIAGRTQATDANVMEMSLSARIAWLHRELGEQKAAHEAAVKERDEELADNPWVPQKQQALKDTYTKTGCRDRTDGTMVCMSVQCFFFRKEKNKLHITYGSYFSVRFMCVLTISAVVAGCVVQSDGTTGRLGYLLWVGGRGRCEGNGEEGQGDGAPVSYPGADVRPQ